MTLPQTLRAQAFLLSSGGPRNLRLGYSVLEVLAGSGGG